MHARKHESACASVCDGPAVLASPSHAIRLSISLAPVRLVLWPPIKLRDMHDA